MADDFKTDLVITPEVSVPHWELSETFIRAAGPGGQHVNTTSSAVQLRWTPSASSIPAPIKKRFERIFGSRLTNDGELVLEASAYRSQMRNREDARARLKEMIVKAATPPKRRIKTRPTAGSVRRRLKAKKTRSEVKALRGKITRED